MEIPGSTLITVRSSSRSPPVDKDSKSRQPSRALTPSLMFTGARSSMQSEHVRRLENVVQRGVITNGKSHSLESRMLDEIEEMDEDEEGDSDSFQCKDSPDDCIVVVDSPTQLPSLRAENSQCGHGLHSVSTTLVCDEDGCKVESFEDEVSASLEWFRSTFNRIGKNGRIMLADFKQAATDCDVRMTL